MKKMTLLASLLALFCCKNSPEERKATEAFPLQSLFTYEYCGEKDGFQYFLLGNHAKGDISVIWFLSNQSSVRFCNLAIPFKEKSLLHDSFNTVSLESSQKGVISLTPLS